MLCRSIPHLADTLACHILETALVAMTVAKAVTMVLTMLPI